MIFSFDKSTSLERGVRKNPLRWSGGASKKRREKALLTVKAKWFTALSESSGNNDEQWCVNVFPDRWRAIFQVQAHRGLILILEGRFNRGFFALPVWGAYINFGGAYFQNFMVVNSWICKQWLVGVSLIFSNSAISWVILGTIHFVRDIHLPITSFTASLP